MSDARQKTCMICGIHGHTLIDCPYRCNFCGESSEACHCLDSSLVKRVMEAETKQRRTKGNRTSEDCSEKKTETDKERGTGSKKTRKTAQTKVSEDLKLQVEGLLEQKERTAELHQKREDELLQTIAAMQSRLEKLEDEMAVGKSTEPSKRKQSKKEESDTRDSEDSEDYSDIAAEEGQSDETADEENGDDLEPTPKRPRGVISGLNLDGVHKRYQGVLKILRQKRCSLAEAMRLYGVPRNTIRDYIGLCELKILDEDKYDRVVGAEREKAGKVSVKTIELRCRDVLKDYQAQSKKMKEDGKLLPFHPGKNFSTRK